MKKTFARFHALRSAAVLFLASCVLTAAAPAPRLDDPIEGEKLARHLRSLAPTEPAEIKGILRIARPGTEPRNVPITSKIMVGKEDWTSVYSAKLAEGSDETLNIRHFEERANEYAWKRADKVQKLAGHEATNRFANSDFALMDLGMEFLHWPKQVLITREMRKGRGCDVLESRPAGPGLYARVVSWIDQETSGLLMAEAYDASGRLLKEFEVKGFKKVAGRWQVRDMEIRNRQTKTSTRLQFQFDEQ
jgi:hypothetical protein